MVKEEQVAVVNHECLFATMGSAEAWDDCVEPERLKDRLVLGYADSGSSVTLVWADLVSESDILPNTSLKMQGIGGRPLTAPVAWMPVKVRWVEGSEDSVGSEEQIAECLGEPEGFLKEVQHDPSLEPLRQAAMDQEVEFSETLT
uniref:Uncharacterized protein n=1 Tax=Sphaerodactylus townsendi TaxID=933632 RepID=A0ACB8G2Q1_9SAUR